MVAEGGSASPQLVPRLEALLGHWRRLYGTQPISERSRLDPAGLAAWTPHIAWINAASDGHLLIRNFGIELIRRFGREATNQNVDDLAPDIATGLRRVLEKAIATSVPVSDGASVQLGRDAAVFCDLILPLAADGARVNQLLFASYELRRLPVVR